MSYYIAWKKKVECEEDDYDFELIEGVCNSNIIPTEDEERWDYFIAGCNRLEMLDKKGADQNG